MVLNLIFNPSFRAYGNQQKILGGAKMEPIRISPSEAYRLAKERHAILVCAYPDIETCSKMWLRGAMTRTEFQARLQEVKKEQEIIFYCT